MLETAKQQEALALYGKAALTAFQQVETALSEEKRLTDRLQLVEAADRDQTKAFELGQMRYDAGVIDQLSLLTIQASTLNARLAALSVRVARLSNRVDLHLSIGGGFEVPPPAPEDNLPPSKIVDSSSKKPQ